jgi:hypothetical protein
MNNKAQQQLLKIISKNLSATKKAVAEGRISKSDALKGYASKAFKATDKQVSKMWEWAGKDLQKTANEAYKKGNKD